MQPVATALLFPGQGSQEAGMGRDVAESSKEAMDYWKKAEKISGLSLRSIYWESEDPALMADTRALQPALTVVNLNIWRMLAPRLGGTSFAPCAVAGHSLGEYSALAAAGVLNQEHVLELVTLRGALMADADPSGTGAMAAVLKLDKTTVEEIVKATVKETGELLLIANHNTPAQFVISGSRPAVETAIPLVKEHKGRAIMLPVSGAFHSPLMNNASVTLAKSLKKAVWNRPRWPVYCNVTGTAVHDGESLLELAIRQMTSSVFWIDTVTNQWRDGASTWLEVGPKGALTKMVKPILESTGAKECPALSVGNLEAIENLQGI